EFCSRAASDVGKGFDVRRRSHRDDLEAVGIPLDKVERRFADRAGGAEDRYFPGHVSPSSWAAAASTATGTNPSSRSRTPPCPGSQMPESFTPARRFMELSNRSPACAAMART